MKHDDLKKRFKEILTFCPEPDDARSVPGLIGWWTPTDEGFGFVCQRCSSRIMGKGCLMPNGSAPVWSGDGVAPCMACQEVDDIDGITASIEGIELMVNESIDALNRIAFDDCNEDTYHIIEAVLEDLKSLKGG